MPDSRHHRGPHPQDQQLFSQAQLPRLRRACRDLCWLFTRGYAVKSALKLVGDRYCLTERQRTAVSRCAGSEPMIQSIVKSRQNWAASGDAEVWIDGYNVLTSIEAALAGAVILKACDGCFRDLASMHGTWRRVSETIPAVQLLGETLEELDVSRCRWLLDKPVSNSARLGRIVGEQASSRGWKWAVELHSNPDTVLAHCKAAVATADREILVRCAHSLNLARIVIETKLTDAWIVDLSVCPS